MVPYKFGRLLGFFVFFFRVGRRFKQLQKDVWLFDYLPVLNTFLATETVLKGEENEGEEEKESFLFWRYRPQQASSAQ